jgi:hypothetical protein
VPSGSALLCDSRGAGALAAFPHAVAEASSCPSIIAARAYALGRPLSLITPTSWRAGAASTMRTMFGHVLVLHGEDVAPRLKIDPTYCSQTRLRRAPEVPQLLRFG